MAALFVGEQGAGALLEFEARASSLELEPENVAVPDGLRDDGKVDIAPARRAA